MTARIVKPKRGRKGNKRPDLTDIKHALRDGRAWTALGTTYKPDDAADYWRIVQHEGASFDLVVEVELHPSGETVTARIPGGVWDVPDLGDEVIVALPNGSLEFQPSIVCRLSSGAFPTAQGPQPGRIAITRAEVVVHDGSGGALPLPTLATLAAFRDAVMAWVPVPNDGGAALKTKLTTFWGTAGNYTWPVSTTVLKGK